MTIKKALKASQRQDDEQMVADSHSFDKRKQPKSKAVWFVFYSVVLPVIIIIIIIHTFLSRHKVVTSEAVNNYALLLHLLLYLFIKYSVVRFLVTLRVEIKWLIVTAIGTDMQQQSIHPFVLCVFLSFVAIEAVLHQKMQNRIFAVVCVLKPCCLSGTSVVYDGTKSFLICHFYMSYKFRCYYC